MKRGTKVLSIVVACVLVVAAVVVAVVLFTRAGDQPAAPADEPTGVAPVTTTVIKPGQVSQVITVYGSVIAPPDKVIVLSAAVESRVKHLRVAGGQTLKAGAPVIEIEPSPDVKLQLIDATNALEGAKKDAAGAHQRFNLKLATSADVQTADQAVRAAQAKIDDLTKRGANEAEQTITAGEASVVSKVDVEEGQLVPAGAPLAELVPAGQIEVRLGVEPVDAMLLRPDQQARLFSSTDQDSAAVIGKIKLITRRVNPESRLVDVFVMPPQTAALLLDSFIRAEITTRTVAGLVVPRDALLPDDQGFSIFTIVGDHAVRHEVKVALQDDTQAVIAGAGISAGDAVVISGNLELDDQTQVKATPAAPNETTTGTEDDK